ncbi:hypothetical protein PCANC_13535 [Puccinia coronata f. sp. avenae]|uniref:Uncharacterized protein n=2 Tax=Puccinia coronata f. sp. avenae TaxID=200324 RepID=A0A2N5USM4_9BASI|nr:hypothetical protein PCANC_13535 [Puccinia coronata f. sp. avenae]
MWTILDYHENGGQDRIINRRWSPPISTFQVHSLLIPIEPIDHQSQSRNSFEMFAVQLLLTLLLFNYALSLPTNGLGREAVDVAGGTRSHWLKRRSPFNKITEILTGSSKEKKFASPDDFPKRKKTKVVTLGSEGENLKKGEAIIMHFHDEVTVFYPKKSG